MNGKKVAANINMNRPGYWYRKGPFKAVSVFSQ